MNTTEYFKRTIQAYLEERAMEDELFAAATAFAMTRYMGKPSTTTRRRTSR